MYAQLSDTQNPIEGDVFSHSGSIILWPICSVGSLIVRLLDTMRRWRSSSQTIPLAPVANRRHKNASRMKHWLCMLYQRTIKHIRNSVVRAWLCAHGASHRTSRPNAVVPAAPTASASSSVSEASESPL